VGAILRSHDDKWKSEIWLVRSFLVKLIDYNHMRNSLISNDSITATKKDNDMQGEQARRWLHFPFAEERVGKLLVFIFYLFLSLASGIITDRAS
jgi:hypothetical protein